MAIGVSRPETVTEGTWLTLVVVAGGPFLAVLSTTVVSVALPTVGRELHASATDLQWIVDSYVLVYASLMVAGGVAGDRHGRKGAFLLGAAIFGFGSLVTGLAPSVGWLLAGRAVQGLGPALLVPGSLTIIRATFADSGQRAMAIGLWSMCNGLALAVGPALGGLIVGAVGWRWVFLLNVPLSASLILLAGYFLPRLPHSPARSRFDWLGAILTVAAVGSITFGLIEGQRRGWASPLILGAFTVGGCALAGFVGWERRRADPLVDISLFRHPSFTAANVAALVVFFGFIGAIVYLSAYLQQVQGRSPVAAGFDVSALGVAFGLAAVSSGRLVSRVGTRLPMLGGLIISGTAMLGLLRLGPHTSIAAMWWNFALVGAGVGLCLTPMTSIAVAAADLAHAGMASAVYNAIRQIGQVLGVAVLGALVYAHLPAASTAGQRLDPAQGALFMAGLHTAIWVAGLALLAVAALTAILIPLREPGQVPPR